MEQTLSSEAFRTDQDKRISETIAREQSRLRQFIRQRVPDASDTEDILQEVFYELVDAYRLMKPVERKRSSNRRLAFPAQLCSCCVY
jgi:DNA-directed RNA polymerase specialized sigma24 family protein